MVIVLNVTLGWVDEHGLEVFDSIFHTSDAVLESFLLVLVDLVMLFNGGSQSFGNIGDEGKSDIHGTVDNLEDGVWEERRRLEGGIGTHLFKEVDTSLFPSCQPNNDIRHEIFGVWDWHSWQSSRARGWCTGGNQFVGGFERIGRHVGNDVFLQ